MTAKPPPNIQQISSKRKNEAHHQKNSYGPHGPMLDVWWARDREILLAGPAGTGKTRFWLERMHFFLQRFPGARGLILRKTRASLTESALVTWERSVLGAGHPAIGRARRDNRTSYIFPCGSECVVAGLDRPDRVLSTEYDLIYVCEATELRCDEWETLVSRLRATNMPFRQITADCNPAGPAHWLRRRCQAGACRLVETHHQDNPLLWDKNLRAWTDFGRQYVQDTLGALTGVRRKRFLEGIWAAAEGLVYPEFATCVVPRPVRPTSPTVISAAGLDWGWNDPTAVVAGLLGQDGRLRLVEEIYQRNMPLVSLVARLLELARTWRLETIWCDPSRPELIDHLLANGLPAAAHRIRAIDTGVAMVSGRITRKLLEVWDTLPATVRESDEYQWPSAPDGRQKRAPTDTNNHAMDALRYLVCGLDEGREYPPMEGITPTTPEEQADRLGLPDPDQEATRLAGEQDRIRRAAELWGEEGWH